MSDKIDVKALQERFNRGEVLEFTPPTVILASASPRRVRYMREAGISFIQIISPVNDSDINFDHPHDKVRSFTARRYTRLMALAKISPFMGKIKNGAVVTADTTVFCKGKILEKPMTKEKCREQHEFLSGKTNTVYTAMAVYFNGQVLVRHMKSKVKIDKLPDEIIEQACNEPETLDAAGYRAAGCIGPYVHLKNDAHHKSVQGLNAQIIIKMLEKLGYPLELCLGGDK